MDWIFWALLAAAAAARGGGVLRRHIASQGCRAFSAERLSMTLTGFLVVNAAFLGLAASAASIWPEHPVFCLSLPALMVVNTCMHLVPMVATRRYSPGSVTALLLYVPLSVYAFHLADDAGAGQRDYGALGFCPGGFLDAAGPGFFVFLLGPSRMDGQVAASLTGSR